jgi:hypothetical protein
MQLDILLAQLLDGGSPVYIAQDESDRHQVYKAILRRIDDIDPFLVYMHCPNFVVMAQGGELLLRTPQEILAEYGPILDCAEPAGSFWLGREDGPADERPMCHMMSLAFYIMQHPVTVRLYVLAVRAGAVNAPADAADLSWRDQQAHPFHPVVMVISVLAWKAAEVLP